MGYTVMQKGAEAPTVEQMKRAMGGVPGFTAFDAGKFCKETFGIIARGLTETQAGALQAGLQAEGTETEIIEDARVPASPVAKVIRRLECAPEALMIYDPYGRKSPVAWDQVRLIAAANTKESGFERTRTERKEVQIKMRGFIPTQVRTTKVEYSTRENTEKLLRAEIVLADGVTQYSIEAEGFSYQFLGEQATQSVTINFRLLLRELAKYAPQATLNRGAAGMLAEPANFVVYPHKNSLQEEIQWWRWRMRG